MKILVKMLQGGECTLEVLPSTLISEIKRHVAKKLGIPVRYQKLLLLGRFLKDDRTVESYPNLKDGTKLNLVVRKPDDLYEASLKYFKKLGMTELEATSAANRLLTIVQDKFDKLSWDDIDRLSLDCLMMYEPGQTRPPVEHEVEADDMYGL